MSIKAYAGLPGSGKTYQVVRYVLLPALEAGRRVITNIAGIKFDKIVEHIEAQGKVARDQIGTVVQVDSNQIRAEKFYPVMLADGSTPDDSESVVKCGDFVLLDEVWKYYKQGVKLTERELGFFREHRHFVNSKTGYCCDVAFITQIFGDINKDVRGTVEQVFVAKKSKEIGLTKYFFVDQFAGPTTARTAKVDTHRQFYDPAYFEFYSSYSASTAKEAKSDTRENILTKPSRLAFGALIVLTMIGSIWYLYRFFHPDLEPAKAAATADKKADPSKSGPSQADAKGAAPAQPKAGARWRVQGYSITNGRMTVVLVDGAGVRRYIENPPDYYMNGHEINVVVDGDMVTRYGVAQSTGFLGGK